MAKDKYYKRIDEPGKHSPVVNGHDDQIWGSNLDNETNKPSGLAKFQEVKIEDLVPKSPTPPVCSNPKREQRSISKSAAIGVGISVVGLGAGAIGYHIGKNNATKQYATKRRDFSNSAQVKSTPIKKMDSSEIRITPLSEIDDCLISYKEAIDDEQANRAVVEIFVLFIGIINRLNYLHNSRIVDDNGTMVQGYEVVNKLIQPELLEAINSIIRENPSYISDSDDYCLTEILGPDYYPLKEENVRVKLLHAITNNGIMRKNKIK